MPLEAFSNTLLDLYDTAGQTDPSVFPSEVIRSVGKLISFDGAVFATGCANLPLKSGLLIDHAYAHNRDPEFVRDYATVTAQDPVAHAFIEGLRQPLRTDCVRLYDELRLEALQAFRRKHQFRQLMLYGDSPTTSDHARWLFLFRDGNDDFREPEGKLFEIMWPHIIRAMDINLHHALERINPHDSTHASALVNARGMIETATPELIELLQMEWPGFGARSLPLQVVNALVSVGRYRGKRIELSAVQKFGYMACTAHLTPLLEILAPSELNVADRFAKGMTHSQIAAHFKVSPSTVRNQLANVYLKLGIHSKVDLVRMMSGT